MQKIKIKNPKTGKIEKIAAADVNPEHIAWDKYSHFQRLAVTTVLSEIETLKFFIGFGDFFATEDTIEEGDLSFFDNVKDINYFKNLLEKLNERRGSFDPLAGDEPHKSTASAQTQQTETKKKEDETDKIEL